MLIFASTDHRGSQIFILALYIWFYTIVSIVMKRSRKKKYSVTQMMFVVIQLIISHKKRESRVHGRPQEGNYRRPPLDNQKSI